MEVEDESRAGLLHHPVNSVNDNYAHYLKIPSYADYSKCHPDCDGMNLECTNEFNHIEGRCGCINSFRTCVDARDKCPRYQRYLELD